MIMKHINRMHRSLSMMRVLSMRVLPMRVLPMRVLSMRGLPMKVLPMRVLSMRVLSMKVFSMRILPKRVLPTGIFLAGLCLGNLFVACSGGVGQRQQAEPYSPIDSDSVEYIEVDSQMITVDEAIDEAFGKGTPQSKERRDLRRKIEEKYRKAGDSLERKLLKGERVH